MKTNQILSVVLGLFSALSLTSCVVDIPVGEYHGPIYQHVQGYPPSYRPQYTRQQQYCQPQRVPIPSYRPHYTRQQQYCHPQERYTGFPPLGGYDPNYRYGMGDRH